MSKVLLCGCGPMSIEYAKVLRKLGCDFRVVGRGPKSAQSFEEKVGTAPLQGGVEKYLIENKVPEYAINAVSEHELGNINKALIKAGVKNILTEKPAAVNEYEFREVFNLFNKSFCNIYLVHNRRYYTSVIKAGEIISRDGGLLSFNFEFTEWTHIVSKLKKGKGVKENWLIHNSSHVIDLAFFFGGLPKEITTYVSGGLEWHPSASIFSGAGISKKGALFSYQANWEAPGRWGVELLTREHRLILRPLEKLFIQKKGSIEIVEYEIDDTLDKLFKPGLFLQTKAFLENDTGFMCTMNDQAELLKFYNKINCIN